MDRTENIAAGGSSRAINRRRLLKGAAAAGVGVAAWSAPNVQSFGFAPAYAAAFTVVAEDFTDKSTINANASSSADTTPVDCVKWGQASGASSSAFQVGPIGPVKVEMDDSPNFFNPGDLDDDLCIVDGGGTPDGDTSANYSGRAFMPGNPYDSTYYCYVTGYNLSCGAGGSSPNVIADQDLTPNCVVGGADGGILIQGCDTDDANSFVFFQVKCFSGSQC